MRNSAVTVPGVAHKQFTGALIHSVFGTNKHRGHQFAFSAKVGGKRVPGQGRCVQVATLGSRQTEDVGPLGRDLGRDSGHGGAFVHLSPTQLLEDNNLVGEPVVLSDLLPDILWNVGYDPPGDGHQERNYILQKEHWACRLAHCEA